MHLIMCDRQGMQVRVLRKSTKSKEVADDDSFAYIADFSHPLVKIKINQIQAQETHDESKRTNEQAWPLPFHAVAHRVAFMHVLVRQLVAQIFPCASTCTSTRKLELHIMLAPPSDSQ